MPSEGHGGAHFTFQHGAFRESKEPSPSPGEMQEDVELCPWVLLSVGWNAVAWRFYPSFVQPHSDGNIGDGPVTARAEQQILSGSGKHCLKLWKSSLPGVMMMLM